ncbi:F-box family protein, partial [Striga asiatica]
KPGKTIDIELLCSGGEFHFSFSNLFMHGAPNALMDLSCVFQKPGVKDQMVSHISQLPDEILCSILSLLTVRDSVWTKSMVNQWRSLPDIRSSLEFDACNVFGKEEKLCFGNKFHRSQFVSAVDKFMELWRGTKVNRLNVDFALGNEHASHIDRWILTAIRMGVEEVRLNFIHTDHESYRFPSRLVDFEKYSSSLKSLCLRKCKLHLYPDCQIWLSHLTVLELSCVPLNWFSVRFILSGGLILTSLTLSDCSLPRVFRIDGTQLHCLKKLAIKEKVMKIDLNCENLESFKYYGESVDITFIHVPILREVDIWLKFGLTASGIFDNLMRNAPQLEA